MTYRTVVQAATLLPDKLLQQNFHHMTNLKPHDMVGHLSPGYRRSSPHLIIFILCSKLKKTKKKTAHCPKKNVLFEASNKFAVIFFHFFEYIV